MESPNVCCLTVPFPLHLPPFPRSGKSRAQSSVLEGFPAELRFLSWVSHAAASFSAAAAPYRHPWLLSLAVLLYEALSHAERCPHSVLLP